MYENDTQGNSLRSEREGDREPLVPGVATGEDRPRGLDLVGAEAGSEGATLRHTGTSQTELVSLTHKRTAMSKSAYFKSLAAKRKTHPFTRKVANGVYLY